MNTPGIRKKSMIPSIVYETVPDKSAIGASETEDNISEKGWNENPEDSEIEDNETNDLFFINKEVGSTSRKEKSLPNKVGFIDSSGESSFECDGKNSDTEEEESGDAEDDYINELLKIEALNLSPESNAIDNENSQPGNDTTIDEDDPSDSKSKGGGEDDYIAEFFKIEGLKLSAEESSRDHDIVLSTRNDTTIDEDDICENSSNISSTSTITVSVCCSIDDYNSPEWMNSPGIGNSYFSAEDTVSYDTSAESDENHECYIGSPDRSKIKRHKTTMESSIDNNTNQIKLLKTSSDNTNFNHKDSTYRENDPRQEYCFKRDAVMHAENLSSMQKENLAAFTPRQSMISRYAATDMKNAKSPNVAVSREIASEPQKYAKTVLALLAAEESGEVGIGLIKDCYKITGQGESSMPKDILHKNHFQSCDRTISGSQSDSSLSEKEGRNLLESFVDSFRNTRSCNSITSDKKLEYVSQCSEQESFRNAVHNYIGVDPNLSLGKKISLIDTHGTQGCKKSLSSSITNEKSKDTFDLFSQSKENDSGIGNHSPNQKTNTRSAIMHHICLFDDNKNQSSLAHGATSLSSHTLEVTGNLHQTIPKQQSSMEVSSLKTTCQKFTKIPCLDSTSLRDSPVNSTTNLKHSSSPNHEVERTELVDTDLVGEIFFQSEPSDDYCSSYVNQSESTGDESDFGEFLVSPESNKIQPKTGKKKEIILEKTIALSDRECDKYMDYSGFYPWTYNKASKDFTLDSLNRCGVKIEIPRAIFLKLFEHQREGVAWMARRFKSGIGGILGDEMGMGKTLSTVTMLGGLMRSGEVKYVLIVCPVSLMVTWNTEAVPVLKKCVPKAQVTMLDSSIPKKRRSERLKMVLTSDLPQLVITTYGLVHQDLLPKDFHGNETNWNVMVLDEGHKIKNPSTKVNQQCHLIAKKNTFRLILTGTPIMNNLKELWALIDWSTSGKILGTFRDFQQRFSRPIEEGRHKDASPIICQTADEVNTRLKNTIKPYLLQRFKDGAFADKLPSYKDYVVFTELSKTQRSVYQGYLDSVAVKNAIDGGEFVLAAITKLKKICGHPSLIEKRLEEKNSRRKSVAPEYYLSPKKLVEQSAKLETLIDLLKKLNQEKHRTLIFSQSTRMLDIIERVLFENSFCLSRIDGSIRGRERQDIVDEFNENKLEVNIMLLSTKVGGYGLTINGASRCIIYDPSWNPAEDLQAVARCYRIGQKLPVEVYRLIAGGTVEEKMYEMQVDKGGLIDVVQKTGATKRIFMKKDRKKLFELSAPGVCDMLAKIERDNMERNSHEVLRCLKNLIGWACHDEIYQQRSGTDSGSSTTPIKGNFENSAVIAKFDQENNASLKYGKSQIVLQNCENTFVPLGPGINSHQSVKGLCNQIYADHRSPMQQISISYHTFSSANEKGILLKRKGEMEQLMYILMEIVGHAPKHDKVKLLENIAHTANELGWI